MECSVIDWCKGSGILFDAFASALFTVLIGGAAAILANVFYRRPKYDKQEAILLDLAKLRTDGVAIRNEGIDATLLEDDYVDWFSRVREWQERLYDKTAEFSPVESERLRTLDWIPVLDPKKSPEIAKLNNINQRWSISEMNETLKRLDRMLEQRFRPTQAP